MPSHGMRPRRFCRLNIWPSLAEARQPSSNWKLEIGRRRVEAAIAGAALSPFDPLLSPFTRATSGRVTQGEDDWSEFLLPLTFPQEALANRARLNRTAIDRVFLSPSLAAAA